MIPDNVLSADKSLLSRDFEFDGYKKKNCTSVRITMEAASNLNKCNDKVTKG